MTLDATGLTIKSAADIEAEIKADQLAAIGPQLQNGPESPLGQFNAIMSTKLGEIWEVLQQVYEALDPDAAAGQQLDAVLALNELTRNPATRSTVTLTISGVDTTAIPIGYTARIPDGAQWETTEAGVITGGTVDLATQATVTGPVQGPAGTITEPVTIIAGVSGVNNAEDALEGSEEETDEEARQRRAGALAVGGAGTDPSLQSRLGEVDTVAQALVISNRTDSTDALGIPSRAFRAMIWPAQADNQPIFDVIIRNQPAGILADGAISGTATDSQGVEQPVAYSLASEQEVHVDVIITTDPLTYTGDDAVKAAVVAFGDGLRIGEDVLLHLILCAVTDAVEGIITIEIRALVGSAPGPSDTTNLAIGLVEIATIDLANVDVNGA
jgi:uncharacterized phage protein gp47/JayE